MLSREIERRGDGRVVGRVGGGRREKNEPRRSGGQEIECREDGRNQGNRGRRVSVVRFRLGQARRGKGETVGTGRMVSVPAMQEQIRSSMLNFPSGPGPPACRSRAARVRSRAGDCEPERPQPPSRRSVVGTSSSQERLEGLGGARNKGGRASGAHLANMQSTHKCVRSHPPPPPLCPPSPGVYTPPVSFRPSPCLTTSHLPTPRVTHPPACRRVGR